MSRFILGLAAVFLIGGSALAAEDPLKKPLYDICLSQDAGWIGKSAVEIETNCSCKAETEAMLATPEFRDAMLKKGVYEGDAFPFGDYDEYQRRVLTECPKLQPLMIDALCSDPAAPADCRQALEEMVRNLK